MISHKYKCIFIHIPRTAGSSIEKWICGDDWWNIEKETKHLLASEAKKKYAKYWNSYFKFSFVRNPWDRVISCLKSTDFFGIQFNKELNFEEYKRKFGFPVTIENDTRFSNRAKILESSKNNFKKNCVYQNILNEELDFIGKFENLEEDINFIKQKLKIKKPFNQHVKIAKSHFRKRYQHYYSKKSIELVRELYKKDIEKFDYDFKRFDWKENLKHLKQKFKRFDWKEYLELRPDLKKNWNSPFRAGIHYYFLQRFDKFIKKNYLDGEFDPNKSTLAMQGGGKGRGLFSLLAEFLPYSVFSNEKENYKESRDILRKMSPVNSNISKSQYIEYHKISPNMYKNLNFQKFHFNKREDVLIGIDTKSNYIIKIELIRTPKKERTIKGEYEVLKHLNNKQCVTCPKVYEYGVISKEELLKIINSRENTNRLIKEKYEYIIQEYIPNDGEPRLADIVLAILEQKRLGIFQGDIKVENIRFDSSKSLCYLIDYDQAIYLTDEQSNFSNEKFFEFCSSYYEYKYGRRNWLRFLEKYAKTDLKTLFRSNCFNLGETTIMKNQKTTNSETGIYHTIESKDVFTDGSRKIDIRGKLLDTIKFEKGEKVLDIGCNTGLLCQYLYDRGCDITGIDNDKRIVIAAKIIANILKKKINYYHVDIDQTDEIEDCDTIMLFSVFHHTRNVVKNAQKIANACNRIIIETKLIEHGAQPHKGYWARTSSWNFQSWDEFYKYCERIFPGFKFEKNLGLGSKKRNICVFVKI